MLVLVSEGQRSTSCPWEMSQSCGKSRNCVTVNIHFQEGVVVLTWPHLLWLVIVFYWVGQEMVESTGGWGGGHPFTHGGPHVQGFLVVWLVGFASPSPQRFDFPIFQASSSGCCHSHNSHAVSGIKGLAEALLHEVGLDVADHGVPDQWGTSYLE